MAEKKGGAVGKASARAREREREREDIQWMQELLRPNILAQERKSLCPIALLDDISTHAALN
jgi:hypothetical protein